MPKKKTIPDYRKILRGDTEYYRTRITDADGKRVDIYGKSCEEVYEKVQAAQKTIAEAIFRRENPTVADYSSACSFSYFAAIRE